MPGWHNLPGDYTVVPGWHNLPGDCSVVPGWHNLPGDYTVVSGWHNLPGDYTVVPGWHNLPADYTVVVTGHKVTEKNNPLLITTYMHYWTRYFFRYFSSITFSSYYLSVTFYRFIFSCYFLYYNRVTRQLYPLDYLLQYESKTTQYTKHRNQNKSIIFRYI